MGFPLISIFLLLFSANISATVGEGRFKSEKGDSLSFIKKQLLFEGLKNVITKEMKKSGLNAEAFWQKYFLKFDEYFAPVDEELKLKFGPKSKGDKEGNRKEYEVARRHRKLLLLRKFGHLTKIIKSYRVESMGRSPQYPRLRFITVGATVNRKKLNDVYFRFMREIDKKNISHIYLSYDLILSNLSWPQIGVARGHDLLGVVLEHWKRKLSEIFSQKIDHIIIADEELSGRLDDFYKQRGNNDETQVSDGRVAEGNHFKNSIWIKIHHKIKMIDEKKILKLRRYELESDMIVLALNIKKNIFFKDYANEKNEYPYQKNHKLSSNVASWLYQKPLKEFLELPNIFLKTHLKRHHAKLKIANIENIVELYKLREFLSLKGARFRMTTKIEKITAGQVVLSLEYRGTEKENIIPFLRALDGQRYSGVKTIRIPSQENPFNLSLIGPLYNNNNQLRNKNKKSN